MQDFCFDHLDNWVNSSSVHFTHQLPLIYINLIQYLQKYDFFIVEKFHNLKLKIETKTKNLQHEILSSVLVALIPLCKFHTKHSGDNLDIYNMGSVDSKGPLEVLLSEFNKFNLRRFMSL